MLKKSLSILLIFTMIVSLCACGTKSAQTEADTIVYGTIYTSNSNQEVVEAMAIKDGKYVYVGDKAGAEAYAGKNTEVIEQQTGMVMAGGTEAHGHYIQQSIERLLVDTRAKSMDELKKDIKTYIDAHPDKTVIGGAGWYRENDLAPNADIDYAKQLDEICADKPIAIFDNDHHQLVVNTKAMTETFPKMGLNLSDASKGREDKDSCSGGIILRLPNGQANGYLRDQAAMYVAYLLLGDAISTDEYEIVMSDMQETLYKQGYTNYNDGMTNILGDNAFKNLVKADSEGKIKVCVRPNFCVYVYQAQSDELINEAVANIETFHNQSSNNIVPAGIKLFVDGVTESSTGLNDVPYIGTDNYGNEVLTEDQVYKITKAANEKGIPVHTHSYGNVAVQNTINAFIKAQSEVKDGSRNSMAHVRNVFQEDYARMAENNIAVAENINWGTTLTEAVVAANEANPGIPRDIQISGYPIKSFVDNGVMIGSSTDAPAANDCPTDVFGIAEIAVDRTALSWMSGLPEGKRQALEAAGLTKEQLKPEDVLNNAECVPVKTALDIMTINGAKVMGIEATRGSIEEGKCADFILVDKNVMECPTDEIHSAQVTSVYYEGELVYTN